MDILLAQMSVIMQVTPFGKPLNIYSLLMAMTYIPSKPNDDLSCFQFVIPTLHLAHIV